jgi:hypothetical protein
LYALTPTAAMGDSWEGEERLLKFYLRSCPRLYGLETTACGVVDKGAHGFQRGVDQVRGFGDFSIYERVRILAECHRDKIEIQRSIRRLVSRRGTAVIAQ